MSIKQKWERLQQIEKQCANNYSEMKPWIVREGAEWLLSELKEAWTENQKTKDDFKMVYQNLSRELTGVISEIRQERDEYRKCLQLYKGISAGNESPDFFGEPYGSKQIGSNYSAAAEVLAKYEPTESHSFEDPSQVPS